MKFTPGIGVAALSGSMGGTTASHNKGGQYFRNRSIPTNPRTVPQLARRATLSTLSANWQDLTQANRDAWTEHARQNPTTDSLGASILLSGQQDFIKLNSKILLSGNAQIDVPPIVASPPAFFTIDQTADVGAGTFELAFTDPLEAGNQIELWAALLDSAGRNYVENQYRFISFSAVDQATPFANQADIEAVLGTATVGQTLHVKAAQFDPATGQSSVFLRDRATVITTP